MADTPDCVADADRELLIEELREHGRLRREHRHARRRELPR